MKGKKIFSFPARRIVYGEVYVIAEDENEARDIMYNRMDEANSDTFYEDSAFHDDYDVEGDIAIECDYAYDEDCINYDDFDDEDEEEE